MSVLSPAPSTTGKGLFEETSDFRARDDAADRKSGGSYNHSVYEFSATEANEWVGFMQYVRQVCKAGGVALAVRNETGGTLAVGPVRVTGYNASEEVFLIDLADSDSVPADMLLLTALSNNTNGTAYVGGDFTYDTSGQSVGDTCYLADDGTITFSAPSSGFVQKIGEVKVVNASGTIAGFVRAAVSSGSGSGVTDGDKGDITVSSSGSVWTIDNGVVTLAKMANLATDRLIGRDTAGTGVPEALTVGGGVEFSGSGGIQRSALTGDVTASAGSNTTTIAAASVTYAKMQDISATDRLLGRDTAGSGSTEELTVGGGIEFTGSGGIRRSALTGDVTASAGSGTTAIAADAVTTSKIADGNVSFAKIQDTTVASVLIGRGSASGGGDVQEITLGSGLTMSGTVLSGSGLADGDKGDITVTGGGAVWTIDSGAVSNSKIAGLSSLVTGDLVYASGTDTFAKLAVGSAGYFLNSASGVPSWKRFGLRNKISPTALTGDQNDWSPTGLSTATVIRVDGGGGTPAGRTITGLSAGSDGDVIVIENIGSYFITLSHESGSSSAANRFSFGANNISLWTGDSVVLEYDGTSSRWRCAAKHIGVPRFHVHRNGSVQNIPTSGTETKVQFTTETFDSHSWFDNATNYRFTPLLPGKYLFYFATAPSGGLADTALWAGRTYKNGNSSGTLEIDAQQYSSGASTVPQAFASKVIDMNGSTDYIEFYIVHTHGSALNAVGAASSLFAGGYRIGD